jgi:apolipoprotein N-acyltransferase
MSLKSEIGNRKSEILAVGACLLSAVLLRLSYPVPGWFPLAWVALVPWFVVLIGNRAIGDCRLPIADCRTHLKPSCWLAIGNRKSPRLSPFPSVAMGLAAAGLGLSWQYIVTVLGGMGLTIYVALYFILFAWVVRRAVRLGVPFVLAAPVVWVGCEYLRGFLFTGFPWLFVAHTQHPFLAVVQVSDLFGAYAVSFLVVAANACLAEVAVAWRRGELSWRKAAPGGAFVAVLLAGTLAYGHWRLATVAGREGPLVGIVQGSVPQEVKNNPDLDNRLDILSRHCELTRELQEEADSRKLKLSLVVWPETMVQFALNHDDFGTVESEVATECHFLLESLQQRGALTPEVEEKVLQYLRDEPAKRYHKIRQGCFEKLEGLVADLGCPLLIGSHAKFGDDWDAWADGVVRHVTPSEIATESQTYRLSRPEDPEISEKLPQTVLVREGQAVRKGQKLSESIYHNSAYLLRPGEPLSRAERYDKNHLVPFGEFIPLKNVLTFLLHVVPFAKGFTPSGRQNLLAVRDEQGKELRFGVLICFEDVFPYLARGYVVRPDGEGADFLVNISNDGWFKGSHELDQHLAMCAFRAIEFRIGIVRSVNTGVSAIIDPTGRIQRVVCDEAGRRKLVEGVAIGRVRLREGITFYARHGDLFAKACLVLSAAVVLVPIVLALAGRFRRRA